MALVNAPLFSLRAHGKLAGTLVYRARSSVAQAVKYSQPSGLLSEAQEQQRANYSLASSNWSAGGFTTIDLAGWRRLQRLHKPRWSPFNEFLHRSLPPMAAGLTWRMMVDVNDARFTDSLWMVNIENVTPPAVPVAHWGTSPTHQPFTESMTNNFDNFWRTPWLDRPAGGVVFWWCEATTPAGFYSRTGLFQTPPP